MKIAPSENAYLNKYGHEEFSASNNRILELFAVKTLCEVLHAGLLITALQPHIASKYIYFQNLIGIYVFLRISKSICIS